MSNFVDLNTINLHRHTSMSAIIFYHIFKTGQYVQDAKCIDPQELIIVEFARDV